MIDVSRRSLLATGMFGAGALAIPGLASAQTVLAARGFTHSVASGEPGPDEVLLWTRYVPTSGDQVRLKVELSETPDFARVAGGGETITGPWRDWTSKITVTGLQPGRGYYYRFVAPDGTASPIGRTKTLPDDRASTFRAAIFSCSNIAFGFFNAYGHAAARDDLDLWIHLGDYFYEYANGTYPSLQDTVSNRLPQPASEIIHLADYRLRYASYRADPDLQALHARLPVIASWDDHESTNDSWEGGAQNHDPKAEGEWSIRKAASIQAWREWMPVSDEPWKAYDIGTLATLFRTDTRLSARSRPVELGDLLRAPDPARAMAQYRDNEWNDPASTMLGSQQEAWLYRGLKRSVAAGARWQIVGFGTIMGETSVPPETEGWLSTAKPATAMYLRAGIAAGKAGLPSNLDSWAGYPAARKRFLSAAQSADANLVVLCGDSHNAWAFDLAQDAPVGVEFAGHAVSSSGLESALTVDPASVARALVGASPELKWCDTSRRGYMAVTVTPERVSNDWLFVDTVKTRTPTAKVGHTATVRRGQRRMG
ncbi:alkaline phosphatase D family protein [Sphingomonas radiodurans]|uniref:alkaline phosphatase D family protein n=1 Tax=Sphingomonas radiodurans TaxID=2890321 RepID=UPI001E3F2875|nr:alkaline phosphatase D family protein [Sphingomonas radiodurans]WBH17928.1 alkaline phosphatase D family protein [Sphingomonas radiodurans]